MEPLIIEHFGEAILDELFLAFGSMVAEYLEIMKAKYPVIVVSLKKAMHWIELRSIYVTWWLQIYTQYLSLSNCELYEINQICASIYYPNKMKVDTFCWKAYKSISIFDSLFASS